MKKTLSFIIGIILIFMASACSKSKSADTNQDSIVKPTQPAMAAEEEVTGTDNMVQQPDITEAAATPIPERNETSVPVITAPAKQDSPSVPDNPAADEGKDDKIDNEEINEEEIIKNTNYVPNFNILKEHSFWVDLENWGKVYFVAASGEGEFSLDSLYMYLADKNSKILYEFPSFYGNGSLFCGIRAVDFRDLNQDGLKDLIVIGEYMSGIGPDGAKEFPVAGVYLQQQDGFINYPDVDGELNNTGNNKTIDMVVEYLDKTDILP